MDNSTPANPTSSAPSTPIKSDSTPPVHDHGTHLSRKTVLLILGLGGITLFFLFLALFPQTQNTAKKEPSQVAATSPTPTPTPAAQSVLSLVPDTEAPQPGVLKYDVIIDSSINTVNAIQIELGFDPKVFTNVTITQGTFFPKPAVLMRDINYNTGKISYAVGIQPTDYGVKGTGKVATLSFRYNRATAPATTDLTFMPKTLVAAEGVTQSVLKEAKSVTVSLSPQ